MRGKLSLLYFFLNLFVSQAQNLIANGHFEDINICCENNAACSHEAWFKMSTGVPTYFWGNDLDLQDSRLKNTLFLELGSPFTPAAEKCLVTPLLCQMKEGEEYEINMTITPICHVTKEIHILFTDTMSIDINGPIIPSVVFKGNYKRGFIYDKRNEWIRLRERYKATGKERYMIIGSFKTGYTTEWDKTSDCFIGASYAMNEISVTPVNHTLDCDTARMKSLIYAENRRHYFDVICSKDNFNLFPYLLNDGPHIVENNDPRVKKFALEKKAKEKPIDNVLRNLNFDLDKSNLKPEAYQEVNRLVVILYNKRDKNVKIVGYTDTQGSDEHNMALSIARAKAVVDYLVRKGINPARISYEGKGAADPIDQNDTEAGHSNNRRVEFFLTD